MSGPESDQRAVRACLAVDPPLRGIAAYHCQQAAEKLLKGFLVRAQADFGKTHDLDRLGQSVIARFPAIAPLVTQLAHWTTWGVAYRYPAEPGPEPEPSPGELSAALDLIVALTAALHALAPPSAAADGKPDTH